MHVPPVAAVFVLGLFPKRPPDVVPEVPVFELALGNSEPPVAAPMAAVVVAGLAK